MSNISHPNDGPPVPPREIFFVQLDGTIYTEGSVWIGTAPKQQASPAQLNVKGDIQTAGALISGQGIRPPHLRDAAARNDTIYLSIDSGSMVYKDERGIVHKLY